MSLFSPEAWALTRANLEDLPLREEEKKAERGTAACATCVDLSSWVARGANEDGKALREQAIDSSFRCVSKVKAKLKANGLMWEREGKVTYIYISERDETVWMNREGWRAEISRVEHLSPCIVSILLLLSGTIITDLLSSSTLTVEIILNFIYNKKIFDLI